MSRRAIPRVPTEGVPRTQFDTAVKENIEAISGLRGGRIVELIPSATLAEVIQKTNEIIRLLQS